MLRWPDAHRARATENGQPARSRRLPLRRLEWTDHEHLPDRCSGRDRTTLTALLTARGDRVTSMHRDPQQAETIAANRATPVAGDLIADSVEELAGKLVGHDAVVFSAGAPGTGRT